MVDMNVQKVSKAENVLPMVFEKMDLPDLTAHARLGSGRNAKMFNISMAMEDIIKALHSPPRLYIYLDSLTAYVYLANLHFHLQ